MSGIGKTTIRLSIHHANGERISGTVINPHNRVIDFASELIFMMTQVLDGEGRDGESPDEIEP